MAGNKEAFQKAMNMGHSAAWDQDWRQAASYYNRALEEFPQNPQAISSIGLALFEMQDYENALRYYQNAASILPNDPVAYEKIAHIYERLGQLDNAVKSAILAADRHLKGRSVEKALDNYTHILSIQPDNLPVRTRVATIYERIGQKDLALNEFIAIAALMQASGDVANAAKTLDHAQQVLPDSQEVRLAMQMLRNNQPLPRPSRPKGGTGPVRMANVRHLTEEDQETSGLDPIQESRHTALMHLAGQLFDQADELAVNPGASSGKRGINQLARGKSDPSNDSSEQTRIVMHLGQAIDSQTQGDLAQAAVELEHAINLGFNQASAHYLLGFLLQDSDEEHALQHLSQALKSEDYMLGANLISAQILERNQRVIEASVAYLQALAIADTYTVPHDQAELLMQYYDPIIDTQNDEKDEVAAARLCQTIREQLVRADWRDYLTGARAQLPQQPAGNPPLPIAEIALEMRNPQVVDAMAQVRLLSSQGKVRSAQEEALYALQYAPTYLPLHLLVAELMLQNERVPEAVRKFMIVADLYTVRGEINRAIRTLKRVSSFVPMDLNVRQRLIDLQIEQGNIEEALVESNALADMHYRLADLDKARQLYLDTLKIASKSKDNRDWGVKLLWKVADIDLQRLNLRQSLRMFEQIRTIQPEEPTVRAQLVTINYRLGQDAAAAKEMDDYIAILEGLDKRDDAIAFISDLLIDYGQKVDLRRRLADLYVHNHQINEAVTQLDAVADAYMNEGKHMEAINMIETIIALQPANIEEYRTALESLRRDLLRK